MEALLIAHPKITDAAVIGIPDPEAGELPKAFVVVKNGITEEEIVAYVAEQVAPFKKLRGGVEFIEKIPTSPSGKKLRRELKIRELVKHRMEKEANGKNNNFVEKQGNTSAMYAGKKANGSQVQVVQKSGCCTIS